jgi:hypothetical protein
MVTLPNDGSIKTKLQTAARPVLFLALFFCLVRFWVDPKLIYHGNWQYLPFQIFAPGMRTFADQPPYPGEMLDYIAARLSHLFYFSWAGALIVTAIACLLLIATDKVIPAVAQKKWRQLRFVPPIILLLGYGRYYHHLADSLSLLLALLLVYLYAAVVLRQSAVRFVLFLIFSAAMFCLAVRTYLVFAMLCACYEFFTRRDRRLGLLLLISALLVPLAANFFFYDLELIDAYKYLWPINLNADTIEIVIRAAFLFFLPVAALCLGLLTTLSEKQMPVLNTHALSHRLLGGFKFKPTLETLILLSVTFGAFWFSRDTFARRYLLINYFARNENWSEVLRIAATMPPQQYSSFICHDVNRALFHTGRLPYEMFAYPQHPSGLLLASEGISEPQTLYELGQINKAEDVAFAQLTRVDYYPPGLQLLALINIVKGQPDAARTFLNALRKDFIYADWAKDYLKKLEADPNFSSDPQIQQVRLLMLKKDDLRRKIGARDDFYLVLLDANKRNKMAFEYLMAWYLVTGRLDKFVENIYRLDDFDYPAIPRHYEEAILLYTAMSGKIVDLHGRKVDTKTLDRFERFMQRSQHIIDQMQRYGKIGDEDLAGLARLDEFTDTYYYYYLFRLDSD